MRYFTITAETCHVQDVTEKAREAFGNDDLILVQSNGLKIEVSAITNGKSKISFHFWLHLL